MKSSTSCTVFLLAVFMVFIPLGVAFADDDHHENKHSHHERAHHGEGHDRGHHDDELGAVTNQTYKETCGACHMAYQPGLLQSGSWSRILGSLEDHFGESVDVDEQSRAAIGGYLMQNAADRSGAELSRKIMKSLRGQTPSRITEIPYIRHKHHELSADVFSRASVGSMSNCLACHRTAEQGIFDDDNVAIPR